MKLFRILTMCLLLAGLAACQTGPTASTLPERFSKDVAQKVHIGKPYTVKGKTYYPSYKESYDETGIASWYGPGFHGKKTANGEIYDQYAMTAAHPTLPLPSLVRVTNLQNGQSTVVRVNDRGPFSPGRIIDLSKRAAETIGIKGIEKVRVQYLPQETENYWASGNFTSNNIPQLASRRSAQPVYDSEYMTMEDMGQAPAAPIMSVRSTQVADLKAAESSHQPVQLYKEIPPDVPPPFKATDASNVMQVSRDDPNERGQVPFKYNDDSMVREVEPAIPKSGYYIQAGAFASESNAHRLMERLANIGEAYIDPLRRDERMLYRVRVGPYASHSEASNYLHELFKIGIKDAAVVVAGK